MMWFRSWYQHFIISSRWFGNHNWDLTSRVQNNQHFQCYTPLKTRPVCYHYTKTTQCWEFENVRIPTHLTEILRIMWAKVLPDHAKKYHLITGRSHHNNKDSFEFFDDRRGVRKRWGIVRDGSNTSRILTFTCNLYNPALDIHIVTIIRRSLTSFLAIILMNEQTLVRCMLHSVNYRCWSSAARLWQWVLHN